METSDPEYTLLMQSVQTASILLKKLSTGKFIKIEGQPYPIAMGEDGSVGYLYNGDRVVSDLTVGEFVRMCRGLLIIPEWRE